MTLIADFFPKLRTPKDVVRYMWKKSRFKEPFDRQHDKGFKHCCNLDNRTVPIFTDDLERN